MIHAADRTLRFSPRDLIVYLEGDFAAWCDRMYLERERAGAGAAGTPGWLQPDTAPAPTWGSSVSVSHCTDAAISHRPATVR